MCFAPAFEVVAFKLGSIVAEESPGMAIVLHCLMESSDDLLLSNRGVQFAIDDEPGMVIHDDQSVESFSIQKKWSFDVDLPEAIWFPGTEIFPVSFILLVGGTIPSMFPQNRVHCLSADSYWSPLASSDGSEKMVDIPWWMLKIQSNPMSPPIE